MSDKTVEIQSFDWAALEDRAGYDRWRSAKLRAAEAAKFLPPVEIKNLSSPTDSTLAELRRRCRSTNCARYVCDPSQADPDGIATALRGFAGALGLRLAETHRSAGTSGIVALEVSQAAGKRGYIPYSTRAMNWHTDGYYNAPADYIAAFVLHCVRPATDGGVNQLLDPEIAYIRLRDRDPALLAALMRPGAMTIPENREPDGTLRPASMGPVFFADPATGRLQMRYTARTRSIAWAEDSATQEAQAFLREHLTAGDPLAVKLSLAAGQGVLNNNILHNRTGFAEDAPGAGRLIFRVRFHNRVEGS